MSQITPFTYAVVQNVQSQRQGAIDKERQLRKAQAMERDIAAHDDELEHQVESSEEVQAIQDEPEKKQNRSKRNSSKHAQDLRSKDDDTSHIDVTA